MDASLRRAVAILIGSIIGAGILGLPYVFVQSGFLIGAITLVIVGVVVLFDFLIIGELSVERPGKHQIVGLAEYYLGKNGKLAMQVLLSFGLWGALIAYAIGSADILISFFQTEQIFGLPLKLLISLSYIILLSIPAYFGLKLTEDIETPLVIFIIGILLALCFAAIGHIDLANIQTVNWSKAFLPYGVILFALGGSVVVPEVKQELRGNWPVIRKAILIGISIPLILYFVFSFVVVGVVGEAVTEVSTIAFGRATHPIVTVLGNIFALIAMATSFMAFSLILKDTFVQDYRLKNSLAYALTIGVPLICIFFVTSFARVLEITGAFSAGLAGVLTGFMALRARKINRKRGLKNTIVPYILIVTFLVGLVLTIFELLEFGF